MIPDIKQFDLQPHEIMAHIDVTRYGISRDLDSLPRERLSTERLLDFATVLEFDSEIGERYMCAGLYGAIRDETEKFEGAVIAAIGKVIPEDGEERIKIARHKGFMLARAVKMGRNREHFPARSKIFGEHSAGTRPSV
jgi:hypothetical protein